MHRDEVPDQDARFACVNQSRDQDEVRGFTSVRVEVLVGDTHGLFPGSLRKMQVNHSHMKSYSHLQKVDLAKGC